MARARLPSSWRFVQATLDASPAHIAVLDHRGVIVAVNAAWRRFARSNGLRHRRALLGESYLAACDAATGPDAAPARAAAEGIREVAAGRRPRFELEYACHGPTEARWFLMRATPIPEVGGRIRVMVAHESVTGRRYAEDALREREARIRLLLDSTAEAIFGLDLDGTCTFANRACARMLGYGDPAALIGRGLHGLIHHTRPDGTPYPREECRIYRAFREGRGTHVADEVLWRADGTGFPVEYWSYPVRRDDGGLIGCVVTFLDITERRRAERLKDEFVATVSHELRTPLTAITGGLGLLAGGAAGELPEPARSLVEVAHRNAGRLARLVDDILDVERIASGRMAFGFEPVDLAAAVAQAVRDNRPAAAGRGVVLEVAPAPAAGLRVMADPHRLSQVMANLLSNAIKFSPAGGAVRVTVAEHAGRARISVADQGPGIPDGFRARVFEPFAQADASDSRSHRGSGLGLSIARGIVERHGGRIDFESAPGAGTVFHVDLPIAADAAPAAGP